MGSTYNDIKPKVVVKNEAINKAFQEDEAIKKASEERSRQRLKIVLADEDKIPTWAWCVGSFCIGVIFTATFFSFNWGPSIVMFVSGIIGV